MFSALLMLIGLSLDFLGQLMDEFGEKPYIDDYNIKRDISHFSWCTYQKY